MLKIKNLHVSIQDENQNEKNILRGVNLNIGSAEVHIIMGPNGSGKSTLANVLAGREGYKVLQGEIDFNGKNLLSLSPEERAALGIFLAFQYPTEIPGVNNMYFMRMAMNALLKKKNLPLLDAADFLLSVKSKIKEVGLDESFLHRAVNEGFSGGEKKRNEMLQMLMLDPQLIILDETDSGLDIDAIQMMSSCVNKLRERGKSILIITHYQRLLDYIKPDFVHVIMNGKILRSGDQTLAAIVEAKGYQQLEEKRGCS